jgi:hypothetical protein
VPAPVEAKTEEPAAKAAGEAKIVSLDQFRKK